MANRKSIWVDGPRPDRTTLQGVDGLPMTHLANHPQVGAEEILEELGGGIKVIGYDLEGVLDKFGVKALSDRVLGWLEDQRRTYKITNFVETNCRNPESVLAWEGQLAQVGVPLYHIHVPNLRQHSGTKGLTVVDKTRRKPEPVMYEEACRDAGATPDEAAFVGDKLSDVKGAQAAGYVGRILVPRLGIEDHIGDKHVTRRKQLKYMNAHGLEFPKLEDAA